MHLRLSSETKSHRLADVLTCGFFDNGVMFQGMKELKAAPSRTALITVTVAMITLMVTFLSSLAAGLSHESVSALQHRVGKDSDTALVLEETGTPSLSNSQLNEQQLATLTGELGGDKLLLARDKVGTDPISIMTSPDVPRGIAEVPSSIINNSALSSGNLKIGGSNLRTQPASEDLSFDHMPVIFVSDQDATALQHPSIAAIVPSQALADHGGAPTGTTSLEGNDRWKASAAYTGEQLSLNLMINLLYVISALVLGAFFMVWTMQRLRGVAISSALGASRTVLVADSLGQALLVLLVGIAAGVGITGGMGMLLGGTLPVVLSASTLLQPAVFLLVAGVAGSALSLRPVLKVSPRSAMATA